MTDNMPKVDEIFWGALERDSSDQREAYLNEQCGGDAELRELVEKLLRAQPKAEQFLEKAIDFSPPTCAQTVAEGPGTQIGSYKLLQQIGEGGMGVVYMAEQTEPVRRRVALKIIKAGMDSRQVIARFEAERQALSLMDHPNIAKVFEAGPTESGRPYFVMELVKGQPLTQYCDEHHLTPRQRLELLLPVCQAIQHAHQKGIIHRDIKPTNILVAEYDQRPVPKVIDFGVAKATSQTLTEKTMFTGLGQIVGTLEYMSPEQAKVNQLDIDTRSDIYSLGVLLYELLTGCTPFDGKRLRSAAFDEMLRIIREEEPPRPSTRLSTADTLPSIAANRNMEPARLGRAVRGELDWIVMKALEKDRNRRYETANGLADDLMHYLNDEPVQACPPSARYRLQKFMRRNKRAVAATFILFLTLAVGITGTTLGLIRATDAEAVARKEASEKDKARSKATEQWSRAEDQRQRAESLAESNRQHLIRALVTHGVGLMDAGDPFDALPWFAEALRRDHDDPVSAAKHRLRIESILGNCPRPVQTWFHSISPEFSPDGQSVLMLGRSGALVCSVATGEPVTPPMQPLPGFISRSCFSPDGRRVLIAGIQGARVFDLPSGKLVSTMEEQGIIHAEFSPAGNRVLSAHRYTELRVWDAESLEEVARIPSKNQFTASHGPHESLFSFDGLRVVTVEPDLERDLVRIRELATGEIVAGISPEPRKIIRASFSRDGQRMLTESHERGQVDVWELATGTRVSSVRDPISPGRVSLTVDGSGILRTSQAEAAGQRPYPWARVWDAKTGAPVGSVLTLPTEIRSATWPPHGHLPEGPFARWTAATGGADGKVRIWNAEAGTLLEPILHHPAEVKHISFSSGLNHLLTESGRGSYGFTVQVWDLLPWRTPEVGWQPRFPELLRNVNRPTHRLAAFSRDGRTKITGGRNPRITDVRTNQVVELRHNAEVIHVDYSQNSRWLLTIGDDGTVCVWDADGGSRVAGPLKHEAPIIHAAFHPQGTSLVTTGKDATARVWQLPSGDLLFPPLRHESPDVFRGEFSGPLLLTMAGESQDAKRPWGYPREGRVWNAATGVPVMTLPSGRAALSSKGDRAAIYDSPLDVRIVSIPGGSEIAVIPQSAQVSDAAFSADGQQIVTTCTDGTARVWNAATGKPVTNSLQHKQRVLGAYFSPDGLQVVTICDNGQKRIWDAATGDPLTVSFGGFSGTDWDLSPPARPLTDLLEWCEFLSTRRLDETGNLVRLGPHELEARWLGYRTKYLGQPGLASPRDGGSVAPDQ